MCAIRSGRCRTLPDKCKACGHYARPGAGYALGYYGGQYVSNFNRFSKVYKVMIQADPKFRMDEASLDNALCVCPMARWRLSQFVSLTRSYGASRRAVSMAMFNSIAVNAMPAEGYSTGDAIRAVQETAARRFPKATVTTLAASPVRKASRAAPRLSSSVSVS